MKTNKEAGVRRNYLETVFRHPVLILLPVILALIAGTAYGLTRPRTYTATAVVWTDARIPGESTIGTTGGQTPPSGGQHALFTQLLASRSFLFGVAMQTPMRDSLDSLPDRQADEALSRMASTIVLTTPGPQVLSVTAEQPSPALATGVAAAVASEAIRVETERLTQRAQAQVTYDKEQLDAASQALSDAQAALVQHKRTAPEDTAGEDELSGTAALAQQQFANAQSSYTRNSATLQHVADESFLSVLDRAERAYPVSRRKTVLFGAVGGLLAGGTLSVLALLVLMLRDRSVREESELSEELGLHVVATIDQLPSGMARPVPAAHTLGRQRQPESSATGAPTP